MKKSLFFIASVLLWSFSALVTAQTARPAVKIISVKAGNNQKDSALVNIKISAGHPTRLAYDQNYLQFEFSKNNDSANYGISYQLDGLDYSWISCDNCYQVNYAHLDGGEYKFLVKDKFSNAQPDEFSFIIEGNIWHKWWFIPMLFVYFFAFFGIAVYFFRLNQFRQKHREQWLIHKEKMASMVELTTGVAHEIQNPLNFVNNFSEVNDELIGELVEEVHKGNIKEAIEIANDIKQNLEKINLHGKRADAIVKGMLQHSVASSGQKELTDINKLADEYSRLSYQGLRAKDKSFNAEIKTDFDTSIEKIRVIPQDIGRALLNLYNNAFYAVNEKKKIAAEGYQPTVSIQTKTINDTIEITVTDNGNGIPQNILNKIFQPFFTTKPTGQGTGLGLSLAYDIIKAHDGEIKVESREGEGATFIIALPT